MGASHSPQQHFMGAEIITPPGAERCQLSGVREPRVSQGALQLGNYIPRSLVIKLINIIKITTLPKHKVRHN